MDIVADFDPANPPEQFATSFNTNIPGGVGTFVVYNESFFGLELSYQGNTDYLPPWHSRAYELDTGNANVNWTIHNQLSSNSPPLSEVLVVVYQAGETIPVTGSLPRQNNIGNSVPLATSATGIQNDGNVPGTNIIESTPSDAGSSTWVADNKGNLTIKGDNAGALTTLLQLIAGASPALKLAAAGIIAEILGGLLIDQTLEVVGSVKLDSTLQVLGTLVSSTNAGVPVIDYHSGTDITINAPNAGGNHHIFLQIGGVNVGRFDSNGNFIIKGSLTQNGAP